VTVVRASTRKGWKARGNGTANPTARPRRTNVSWPSSSYRGPEGLARGATLFSRSTGVAEVSASRPRSSSVMSFRGLEDKPPPTLPRI
jgi:hypothetical protein